MLLETGRIGTTRFFGIGCLIPAFLVITQPSPSRRPRGGPLAICIPRLKGRIRVPRNDRTAHEQVHTKQSH